MTQKVLQVGSSAAVTLSKEALKELGLKVGDRVVVVIDKKRKVVSLQSAAKLSPRDEKIAKLTMNFVERYRADLEALAKK
jgi:antitoxin component of MazEF toxin-antitoxin module